MAELLGLVPTKGAERGFVSIKPGGVGGQVTFLRAHLVDAAYHPLGPSGAPFIGAPSATTLTQ